MKSARYIDVLLKFSLLGFATSLGVHLLTFFPKPGLLPPFVWLLHGGVFIAFVPLFFIRNQSVETERVDLHRTLKRAPDWLKRGCYVFGAYALINFMLFFVLSDGGTAERWDDKYVLQNKGTLIRELDEPTFHQYQAYEIRGFSGHWMIFYLISSTIYFVLKNETDVRD